MGAVTGLAILVAAGFWTAAAAGRAPELAVSRILVEGNKRLAEGEILEALGLHPGSNILSLDLNTLKQKLLLSAWVKDVELARILPATLTLKLVERVPLGIAVVDRLYLIDADGVFLDEMGPGYGDLALPVVSGLADDRGELLPGRRELAGRVLSILATDQRLESVVSEIDVSGGADSIRVLLRQPPLTIIGGEADLASRLQEIVPLAEEIQNRFSSVDAVDVRFQGRVYLQLVAPEMSKDVQFETSRDVVEEQVPAGGR
jgi:cell division septal protein FtsQ